MKEARAIENRKGGGAGEGYMLYKYIDRANTSSVYEACMVMILLGTT